MGIHCHCKKRTIFLENFLWGFARGWEIKDNCVSPKDFARQFVFSATCATIRSDKVNVGVLHTSWNVHVSVSVFCQVTKWIKRWISWVRWNHGRRTQGYGLLFGDENVLFNISQDTLLCLLFISCDFDKGTEYRFAEKSWQDLSVVFLRLIPPLTPFGPFKRGGV